MTNLNAANIGMNKYCGPAVLSILTGKNTDECAKVIASINGSYKVEGVFLNDLLRAANRLGFDNKSIPPANSLFATLTRLAVNGDGMYIVSLSDHFVAIEVNQRKIYFCDNHTREPIPAASSARLLQKVVAVNQVFKRPEVTIPPQPKKVSETTLADTQTETSNSISSVKHDPELFQVFGCFTSGKLIAVFRSKIDAMDYAVNNGLQVKQFMDDKKKWLVL